MFGFLADRQDPRLVSNPARLALCGLTSQHGRCEVRVVSPFSMPLVTDDDLCAFDPARFFDVAEAVRTAQKTGAPVGRTGMAPSVPASKLLTHAHRAFGQADFEPLRAAGWTERGYAFDASSAYSFTSANEVTALPRPLVALRSRIVGSAFASDGSGIAMTDRGLVRVDANGTVSLEPSSDVASDLLTRPDLAAAARRLAVRVGDTWWQSRGELRPIGGARATPPRMLGFDVIGGRGRRDERDRARARGHSTPGLTLRR